MPTPAAARWLTDAEASAWLAYRRMNLLVNAQINRDLTQDSGLSEPDYDVLSNLTASDGRRRLTELADHMLWSKSRLSHHITRMQSRGLVAREDVDDDGRGSLVALTAQGRRAIEEAAPDHVASVRRHFIDRLTPEQIRVLTEIGGAVLPPLTGGTEPGDR